MPGYAPLNLRSLNNPRSAMVVGGTGVEFCHASVFAKVVEKAFDETRSKYRPPSDVKSAAEREPCGCSIRGDALFRDRTMSPPFSSVIRMVRASR